MKVLIDAFKRYVETNLAPLKVVYYGSAGIPGGVYFELKWNAPRKSEQSGYNSWSGATDGPRIFETKCQLSLVGIGNGEDTLDTFSRSYLYAMKYLGYGIKDIKVFDTTEFLETWSGGTQTTIQGSSSIASIEIEDPEDSEVVRAIPTDDIGKVAFISMITWPVTIRSALNIDFITQDNITVGGIS